MAPRRTQLVSLAAALLSALVLAAEAAVDDAEVDSFPTATPTPKPGRRFKRARQPSQPPYWLIIPFILVVVGFVVVMIWLIVSDEKQDAMRRADDAKAKSLKFGRMDPRYHKD